MPETRRIWFHVIDTESLEARVVVLPVPRGPANWRVGTPGSGADIEVAEPLPDGAELFVFAGGNHLILQGKVVEGAAIPTFGIGARAETGEWDWSDPLRLKGSLRGDQLYVRFDSLWLRIGRHALRASWKPLS